MTESAIAPILGRVPSGIFILTVRHDGQETGMLASWVMQAAFEPLSVTVAVKRGRYVADWIAAGAPFVLNVVSEEQKSLIAHFGRGFEPGAPAFEGLEVEQTESGAAVLAETVGHLECRATAHIDSGDHRIFLATVTGGRLNQGVEPMVHIRKSGAHY